MFKPQAVQVLPISEEFFIVSHFLCVTSDSMMLLVNQPELPSERAAGFESDQDVATCTGLVQANCAPDQVQSSFRASCGLCSRSRLTGVLSRLPLHECKSVFQRPF
jgi:hypothetical protein